jgi:hypothetical protein
LRNSALARHPVSLAGVVLATVSAVAFIALFIAELLGLFDNPYARARRASSRCRRSWCSACC